MQHAIEKFCDGIFRSYKTFRHNGDVLQHSMQAYEQWNFEENRLFTISRFQNGRLKILHQTDKWAIGFNNKRHYLLNEYPALNYEIITLNHTGLVIADHPKGEKIFFAKMPGWYQRIEPEVNAVRHIGQTKKIGKTENG